MFVCYDGYMTQTHTKHRSRITGKTAKKKAINEWLRENKKRINDENNRMFRENRLKAKREKSQLVK